MKVFICGIIQGSISDFAVHEQSYRTRLRQMIEDGLAGAEVYCPVSLHPDSLLYDDSKAFRVFEESIEAAKQSDLLVAYVPEASMGSAIEMWEAKKAGVKIIAISPMEHNWVVRYASDVVVRSIEDFGRALQDGRLKPLLEQTGPFRSS
jgi:NAD-dependent SIR2 family protein deacetylase